MGGPNAIIKFLYFLYWAPTDPEGGTNLFYFYVHVLAVRQCVNGANKGCCQCASFQDDDDDEKMLLLQGHLSILS
jgi:hypothetical protein